MGRLFETLRYASPLLVLAAAVALSVLVLPRMADASQPGVFAAALTIDFTIVAPGIVYLLLVRAKRAPWIVIIPTFIIGHALAWMLIPKQHHMVLEIMRLLVIPAELVFVVYLLVRARQALVLTAAGAGDFATRFRSAARSALPSRIPADILTTEISLLYYAFRWSKGAPSAVASYTVHRESGYLMIVSGLMMAMVVEMTAVHFFVSQWSNLAAWILTALSIYTCVWLVGDYRAMTARHILITPTHLLVRIGVRWEADISMSNINDVRLLPRQTEKPSGDTLVANVLDQPNFAIRLVAPIEVTGMYGFRRTVQEIWLTVDEAKKMQFELSIERPIGQPDSVT